MSDCTRELEIGSITSPDNRKCPGPLFARLRNEAPVYWDPIAKLYVISRYDDVVYVGEHPELFSNNNEIMVGRQRSPVAGEIREKFAAHGFPELHTLVTADPPYHTRNRAVLDKIFTPSFVKSFEPRILAIVDSLIDGFAANGEVDFHMDFAVRLPMYIILDRLGLPREDLERIKRWSDVALLRSDPTLDPAAELALADEFIDMQNYLHGHMEECRQHPDNGLLSLIANAKDEAGTRLSNAEAVSIAFQVMVAGNETTTTVLMSLFKRLLDDPALMASVRADLAQVPGLIEETLRLDTPIPTFYRTAIGDATIGGVHIPQGSIVAISYYSANKDEERWSDALTVDPKRKGIRSHFGFGRGIHYCIGHLLAKAELRIAVSQLLTRLENIRLSSKHPDPSFLPHPFAFTLNGMHWEFDTAA